ncbi:AAA family ATPase [Citricoccus nitrophenolicus]|uniref:AAA family ATPase n=1 Tax=Citricoccus nitrophenolicus TaxID=863575 RepID=UPI0039B46E32
MTATEDRANDAPALDLTARVADAAVWLEEFHGHDDGGRLRLAENTAEGWEEYARGVPLFRPDLDHAQAVQDVARQLVTLSDLVDIYACPYAHARTREKGGAAARRHSHADVDGPLDLGRVRFLGAMAVASGSASADGRPHGHVYVRLDRPVTVAEHTALCVALGGFLGPDADPSKVGDADVLRPAGTVNHKSGAVHPVRWLVRPEADGVRTWEPDALARVLGVPWPVAQELEAVADDDALTSVDAAATASVPCGHAYEAAVIRGITNDLDASAAWPEGHKDGHGDEGRGWEKLQADAALRLSRLALADWSALTLTEARGLFDHHAPTGGQWTTAKRAAKWEAQHSRALRKGPLTLPAGHDIAEVAVTGTAATATEETTVTAAADPSGNADESAARAVAGRFPLLDLAALVDPERPPRPWFWEQIVPEGEHVSLVAPAGVGKSLLVLALSVAAARGSGEFIGRAVTLEDDARVLYVDMENSEDDFAERLVSLGVSPGNVAELQERLLVLSMPELRGLDTTEGAAQLRAVLDHYGIGRGDLLVLDSTQRVTQGEENSNDTMRNLYNLTSAELKRRRLTVIRTDNTGKDSDKGARGASAKRDDVGASWLLRPDEKRPEVFSLVSAKRRSAPGTGRGALVFRRHVGQDGLLRFDLAATDDGTPSYGDLLSEARALLDALGVDGEAGVHVAWETVKTARARAEAKGEQFPEWAKRDLIRRAQNGRGYEVEVTTGGGGAP